MTKKINLDPVLKHIAKKLIDDRQTLSRMLDAPDPQGMRGFEEQERLLEHIQAGVRALDVLEGCVSLESGEHELKPSMHAFDMEKLAAALRPNGAAH